MLHYSCVQPRETLGEKEFLLNLASFGVHGELGWGGAGQWCKAAQFSPFQGFFHVGSHTLIHSWLFPRADSTQAAQVPLVPRRHTENIKPRLLDKP